MLLLLCGVTSRVAAAESGKERDALVVEVRCLRNGVTVGDSCEVWVQIYSPYPIASIEKVKFPKLKNCRVEMRSVRMKQRFVRRGGAGYYTVGAARVVLTPERAGTLQIPECKVKAVLKQPDLQTQIYSPLFGYRVDMKLKKCTAKSRPIKIAVREVPLKTTEELLRSGKNVM